MSWLNPFRRKEDSNTTSPITSYDNQKSISPSNHGNRNASLMKRRNSDNSSFSKFIRRNLGISGIATGVDIASRKRAALRQGRSSKEIMKINSKTLLENDSDDDFLNGHNHSNNYGTSDSDSECKYYDDNVRLPSKIGSKDKNARTTFTSLTRDKNVSQRSKSGSVLSMLSGAGRKRSKSGSVLSMLSGAGRKRSKSGSMLSGAGRSLTGAGRSISDFGKSLTNSSSRRISEGVESYIESDKERFRRLQYEHDIEVTRRENIEEMKRKKRDLSGNNKVFKFINNQDPKTGKPQTHKVEKRFRIIYFGDIYRSRSGNIEEECLFQFSHKRSDGSLVEGYIPIGFLSCLPLQPPPGVSDSDFFLNSPYCERLYLATRMSPKKKRIPVMKKPKADNTNIANVISNNNGNDGNSPKSTKMSKFNALKNRLKITFDDEEDEIEYEEVSIGPEFRIAHNSADHWISDWDLNPDGLWAKVVTALDKKNIYLESTMEFLDSDPFSLFGIDDINLTQKALVKMDQGYPVLLCSGGNDGNGTSCTKPSIQDWCNYLRMDYDRDKDLIWVAEAFAETELPTPWTSYKGIGSIVCFCLWGNGTYPEQNSLQDISKGSYSEGKGLISTGNYSKDYCTKKELLPKNSTIPFENGTGMIPDSSMITGWSNSGFQMNNKYRVSKDNDPTFNPSNVLSQGGENHLLRKSLKPIKSSWRHPFYDYFLQLRDFAAKSSPLEIQQCRLTRMLWNYEVRQTENFGRYGSGGTYNGIVTRDYENNSKAMDNEAYPDEKHEPLISPDYVHHVAEILEYDLEQEPFIARDIKQALKKFSTSFHEADQGVKEVPLWEIRALEEEIAMSREKQVERNKTWEELRLAKEEEDAKSTGIIPGKPIGSNVMRQIEKEIRERNTGGRMGEVGGQIEMFPLEEVKKLNYNIDKEEERKQEIKDKFIEHEKTVLETLFKGEISCVECGFNPALSYSSILEDYFCLFCFHKLHQKGTRKKAINSSYQLKPCICCEKQVATLRCSYHSEVKGDDEKIFCKHCYCMEHLKTLPIEGRECPPEKIRYELQGGILEKESSNQNSANTQNTITTMRKLVNSGLGYKNETSPDDSSDTDEDNSFLRKLRISQIVEVKESSRKNSKGLDNIISNLPIPTIVSNENNYINTPTTTDRMILSDRKVEPMLSPRALAEGIASGRISPPKPKIEISDEDRLGIEWVPFYNGKGIKYFYNFSTGERCKRDPGDLCLREHTALKKELELEAKRTREAANIRNFNKAEMYNNNYINDNSSSDTCTSSNSKYDFKTGLKPQSFVEDGDREKGSREALSAVEKDMLGMLELVEYPDGSKGVKEVIRELYGPKKNRLIPEPVDLLPRMIKPPYRTHPMSGPIHSSESIQKAIGNFSVALGNEVLPTVLPTPLGGSHGPRINLDGASLGLGSDEQQPRIILDGASLGLGNFDEQQYLSLGASASNFNISPRSVNDGDLSISNINGGPIAGGIGGYHCNNSMRNHYYGDQNCNQDVSIFSRGERRMKHLIDPSIIAEEKWEKRWKLEEERAELWARQTGEERDAGGWGQWGT